MDETPSLWHWLINKNIDGVVTNFPAIGFKYKLAKSGTQKYAINRNGIYFGKNKIPTMINPYVGISKKSFIKPREKAHVSYGVKVDDRLFYQIAERTFISAEFVNLDLKPNDIRPFQNKQILVRPNHEAQIYKYPENTAKTDKKLKPRTLYKILNFNGAPQNMWLYTTKSWIKAKDILFYGFFDSSSLNTFENLSRISHYTNLALLPSTGQYSIHEANLFEKLKRVNNIIN